ncbi:hypothetical protein ACFL2K_00735, partial [Candidatus Margulisiibacteriota bacterium]
MIDTERFALYRITGILGFIGIVILVSCDRLGIWFFYKYIKIKIHNKIIQHIISSILGLLGLIII